LVETQSHHAMTAGVSLEYIPLKADILLYVDRLKLQHILGHLVGNAIKFSPEKSKIRLEAALWNKGLRLYVHDNGAGITSNKLNSIVSSLQEESCWATASGNTGIGLGLALTREFVALHGGQVEITSAPGKGTTIAITLPKNCIRDVTTKAKKPEYLRQAVS